MRLSELSEAAVHLEKLGDRIAEIAVERDVYRKALYDIVEIATTAPQLSPLSAHLLNRAKTALDAYQDTP
jgi:hypothetical protein